VEEPRPGVLDELVLEDGRHDLLAARYPLDDPVGLTLAQSRVDEHQLPLTRDPMVAGDDHREG